MKKIQKLPFNIFTESFKYGPKSAVCLILINKDGGILLTQRKIAPYKGHWHLPGSFILKGEKLEDCIVRIARVELGTALPPQEFKLIGVFDDLDKDPRGHVINIIFKYQIKRGLRLSTTADTKNYKFFTQSQFPLNIGFNHKDVLNKLML